MASPKRRLLRVYFNIHSVKFANRTATLPRRDGPGVDWIRPLPHYGAGFFRDRIPNPTATLPRRDGPWVDWIRTLPHYGDGFSRDCVAHPTATLPRRAKDVGAGLPHCVVDGLGDGVLAFNG